MDDLLEAAADYRRAWMHSSGVHQALRTLSREWSPDLVGAGGAAPREGGYIIGGGGPPRTNSEALFEKASKVCDKHRWALHDFPGVVGVGVSRKMKSGIVMESPCIVVFVKRKMEGDRFKSIPRQIEGVPTDVVESGDPVLRSYSGRVRPLQPGYSISHPRSKTGTLGCFVRRSGGEQGAYILSNNHVLANNNAASRGDPIVQPGSADSGQSPADTAAKLEDFIPITAATPNIVDAAIAKPLGACECEIPGVGLPHGILKIKQTDLEVEKVGRTTGLTEGVICAFGASSGPHEYEGVGNVFFTNQYVTSGMSSDGDSGSLLVTKDDRLAVGLLYGGHAKKGVPVGAKEPTDFVTYYNDINNVLVGFRVDLVTI